MGYNIKSKTQISIIVPTYKRPELLSSCLISLMKQSVKSDGYEVIVADDDPRKSAQSVTEKVIARFPKRIMNKMLMLEMRQLKKLKVNGWFLLMMMLWP